MKKLTIILKQLSTGNQLAFRQLYDLYSQVTYQQAFHITKTEKLAEEIVQDTFLKLWDNREKIDVESNIQTYLYVICRNLCFNALKTIKRERALFTPLASEFDYDHYQTDDLQAAKDFNNTLEQLLKTLPARQQQVFRLSRLEGLSHAEISEQLGISTNTVKNHMVQAMKKMKELFDQNNETLFFSYFFLNLF